MLVAAQYSKTQRREVTTYYVSTRERGALHCSIQQAIDKAEPFSRIVIAAGQYFETITVTQPIELIGEEGDPPEICSRGVCVSVNADVECFFEGLHIVSKAPAPRTIFTRDLHAAVRIVKGKPTFYKCKMTSVYVGGHSYPCIHNCVISGNIAGCGLVVAEDADGEYLQNAITNHIPYCVLVKSRGTPVFTENTIYQEPKIISAMLTSAPQLPRGGGAVLISPDGGNVDSDKSISPRFVNNRIGDEVTPASTSLSAFARWYPRLGPRVAASGVGAVMSRRGPITDGGVNFGMTATAANTERGIATRGSSRGGTANSHQQHGSRRRGGGGGRTAAADGGAASSLHSASSPSASFQHQRRSVTSIPNAYDERSYAALADRQTALQSQLCDRETVKVDCGCSPLFDDNHITGGHISVSVCVGGAGVFTNNQISHGTMFGANLRPYSSTILKNNVITQCGTGALLVASSASLSGNTISDCIGAGCVLFTTPKVRCYMTSNSFVANDVGIIAQELAKPLKAMDMGGVGLIASASPTASPASSPSGGGGGPSPPTVSLSVGDERSAGTASKRPSVSTNNAPPLSSPPAAAAAEPTTTSNTGAAANGEGEGGNSNSSSPINLTSSTIAKGMISLNHSCGALLVGSRLDMVVEEVSIGANGPLGVIVALGANPLITRCHFDRGPIGMLVCEGGNPTVTSCRFESHLEAAIAVEDHGKGTISKCDFRSFAKAGVRVLDAGKPLVEDNNFTALEGVGVDVSTGGIGRIVRNNFNTLFRGIVVSLFGDPVISENKIRSASDVGILIHNEGCGTVVSNRIVECSVGVASLTGGEATIRDNTIGQSTKWGLYCGEGSLSLVEKNRVVESSHVNMMVEGADNNSIITANVFERSHQVGIRMAKGATATITRNRTSGDAVAGVLSELGDFCLFAHNNVERAVGNGVAVAAGGSSTFESNDIHNGSHNGVYLAHGSNATIRDCTVRDNGANGVVVEHGSGGSMSDCTVHDNAKNGVAFVAATPAAANTVGSGNAPTAVNSGGGGTRSGNHKNNVNTADGSNSAAKVATFAADIASLATITRLDVHSNGAAGLFVGHGCVGKASHCIVRDHSRHSVAAQLAAMDGAEGSTNSNSLLSMENSLRRKNINNNNKRLGNKKSSAADGSNNVSKATPKVLWENMTAALGEDLIYGHAPYDDGRDDLTDSSENASSDDGCDSDDHAGEKESKDRRKMLRAKWRRRRRSSHRSAASRSSTVGGADGAALKEEVTLGDGGVRTVTLTARVVTNKTNGQQQLISDDDDDEYFGGNGDKSKKKNHHGAIYLAASKEANGQKSLPIVAPLQLYSGPQSHNTNANGILQQRAAIANITNGSGGGGGGEWLLLGIRCIGSRPETLFEHCTLFNNDVGVYAGGDAKGAIHRSALYCNTLSDVALGTESDFSATECEFGRRPQCENSNVAPYSSASPSPSSPPSQTVGALPRPPPVPPVPHQQHDTEQRNHSIAATSRRQIMASIASSSSSPARSNAMSALIAMAPTASTTGLQQGAAASAASPTVPMLVPWGVRRGNNNPTAMPPTPLGPPSAAAVTAFGSSKGLILKCKVVGPTRAAAIIITEASSLVVRETVVGVAPPPTPSRIAVLMRRVSGATAAPLTAANANGGSSINPTVGGRTSFLFAQQQSSVGSPTTVKGDGAESASSPPLPPLRRQRYNAMVGIICDGVGAPKIMDCTVSHALLANIIVGRTSRAVITQSQLKQCHWGVGLAVLGPNCAVLSNTISENKREGVVYASLTAAEALSTAAASAAHTSTAPPSLTNRASALKSASAQRKEANSNGEPVVAFVSPSGDSATGGGGVDSFNITDNRQQHRSAKQNQQASQNNDGGPGSTTAANSTTTVKGAPSQITVPQTITAADVSTNAPNSHFRGNTISHNGGRAGLVCTTDAKGSIGLNTLQQNDQHGLVISAGATVTLKGNHVTANKRNGVVMLRAAKATLDGNRVAQNLAANVLLEEGADGSLVNNHILSGRSDGVVAMGDCTTTFSGNTIEGHDLGNGIVIDGFSPRLLICQNTIAANHVGINSIPYSIAKATVERNKFSHNAICAVILSEDSDVSVTNNLFEVASCCIQLCSKAKGAVRKNIFTRSHEAIAITGPFVATDCQDNTFANNNIGFALRGSDGEYTLQNNVFGPHEVAAVLVEAKSTSAIHNNKFVGGARGILVQDGSRPWVRSNIFEHNVVGVEVKDASCVVDKCLFARCGSGVVVNGEVNTDSDIGLPSGSARGAVKRANAAVDADRGGEENANESSASPLPQPTTSSSSSSIINGRLLVVDSVFLGNTVAGMAFKRDELAATNMNKKKKKSKSYAATNYRFGGDYDDDDEDEINNNNVDHGTGNGDGPEDTAAGSGAPLVALNALITRCIFTRHIYSKQSASDATLTAPSATASPSSPTAQPTTAAAATSPVSARSGPICAAIVCEDGSAPFTAEENSIGDNTIGIYCRGLASPTIAKNFVSDNEYGIVCEGQRCSPTLKECALVGNKHSAVYSTAGACPRVLRCFFREGAGVDPSLVGGGAAVLETNTLKPSIVGAVLVTNKGGGLVSGCVFRCCSTCIIVDGANGLKFSGNRLSVGGCAVVARGSPSHRTLFTNNAISGFEIGVAIAPFGMITQLNHTLITECEYGFVGTEDGQCADISATTFSRCSKYGVLLRGIGRYEVKECVISESGVGLYVSHKIPTPTLVRCSNDPFSVGTLTSSFGANGMNVSAIFGGHHATHNTEIPSHKISGISRGGRAQQYSTASSSSSPPPTATAGAMTGGATAYDPIYPSAVAHYPTPPSSAAYTGGTGPTTNFVAFATIQPDTYKIAAEETIRRSAFAFTRYVCLAERCQIRECRQGVLINSGYASLVANLIYRNDVGLSLGTAISQEFAVSMTKNAIFDSVKHGCVMQLYSAPTQLAASGNQFYSPREGALEVTFTAGGADPSKQLPGNETLNNCAFKQQIPHSPSPTGGIDTDQQLLDRQAVQRCDDLLAYVGPITVGLYAEVPQPMREVIRAPSAAAVSAATSASPQQHTAGGGFGQGKKSGQGAPGNSNTTAHQAGGSATVDLIATLASATNSPTGAGGANSSSPPRFGQEQQLLAKQRSNLNSVHREQQQGGLTSAHGSSGALLLSTFYCPRLICSVPSGTLRTSVIPRGRPETAAKSKYSNDNSATANTTSKFSGIPAAPPASAANDEGGANSSDSNHHKVRGLKGLDPIALGKKSATGMNSNPLNNSSTSPNGGANNRSPRAAAGAGVKLKSLPSPSPVRASSTTSTSPRRPATGSATATQQQPLAPITPRKPTAATPSTTRSAAARKRVS